MKSMRDTEKSFSPDGERSGEQPFQSNLLLRVVVEGRKER